MRYGVYPLGSVNDVYAWSHNTLADAENVALGLASKHHCQVIVFEIICSYMPTVTRKSLLDALDIGVYDRNQARAFDGTP